MSHSPAAGRQMTPIGRNTSGGHVELAPVHTSSGSHASLEPARYTVPALPAACWQASLVPLHVSVVQALPSSVQAVPLACLASAGHVALLPVQKSSRSHSSTDGRQTVVEDSNASAAHVELVPVHVSATSQTPAEARHVAPALPAGCWQASAVPLHWSAVQGVA